MKLTSKFSVAVVFLLSFASASIIRGMAANEHAGEQSVLERFFGNLAEKDFAGAASFFSPDFLAQLPASEFEAEMKKLIDEGLMIKVAGPRSGGGGTYFGLGVMDFQKLLEIKKADFPGGELWECLCRCEKDQKVAFRFALDDSNRIAGYQILPAPDDGLRKYCNETNLYVRGSEVLKRLGFFCSILIDSDPDEFARTSAQDLIVWRQSDDVKDGKPEWKQHNGPYETAVPEGDPRQLLVNYLSPGTYCMALKSLPDRGEAMYAEVGSVTVDLENRTKTVVPKTMHYNSLEIKAVDAETDERIEGTLVVNLKRKSDRLPEQDFSRHRSFNSDDTFYYQQIPSGTYTFEVVKYDNDQETPFYVPERDRYEIELPNEADYWSKMEYVVKFQREAWTPERLKKRFPFIVEGTVKTFDGKPVPAARIVFDYNYHDPIRMRFYKDVGKPHFTDENGRFSVRFAPMDFLGKRFLGTRGAEEIWIDIRAEKSGFTDTAPPDEDIVKDDNRFSKRSVRSFLTINPKPEPEQTPDSFGNWSNGPPRDIPKMYPEEAQKIELTLWPAATLEGRVLFETDKEREETTSRHDKQYPVLFLSGGGTGSNLDDDGRFSVSFQPGKNMHVDLRASLFHLAVTQTPNFDLDKIDRYEIVLRWKTLRRNDAEVKQLQIESLKDSRGNDVPTRETLRSKVHDYQFLRWRVHGRVYDKDGNPVERPSVSVSASFKNGGGGGHANILENGEYERIIVPTHRHIDEKTGLPEKSGVNVTVSYNSDGLKAQRTFYLSDEETDKVCDLRLVPDASVTARVLDKDGKPLTNGYELFLGTEGSLRYQGGTLYHRMGDEDGYTLYGNADPEEALWFVLYKELEESEPEPITSESLNFKPGEKYRIDLRVIDAEGKKKLAVETIIDSTGKTIPLESLHVK